MTTIELLVEKTRQRKVEKLFRQAEKVERFRAKYGDESARTKFQIKKLEDFQRMLGHLTGYNLS